MKFTSSGGRIAWSLIGAVVLLFASTATLLGNTALVRHERDITRLVFNDNVVLLDRIRERLGLETDSLHHLLAESPEIPKDSPYLVVSIEERKLWYKHGDSTLFETRVAVGSGKTLVKDGGSSVWRFETPRGRLMVQRKEKDPHWVPPDWHFIEYARNRGLGVIQLRRGDAIPMSDGSVITARGTDVVRRYPDGREVPFTGAREIVVNGSVIIPPFGTNQRKFDGVLGTHRLNLGDGYALHGTNVPESIGQAVSHGCIRLLNQDIEYLYNVVPVGAPVYIY